MGIFSDTLEDNRERAYELFPLVDMAVVEAAIDRGALPPVYPCPSCFQTYASEPALTQHLFGAHSRTGFFVRVNGRVVLTSVFVSAVRSVELVPLGPEPIDVRLTSNDRGRKVTVDPYHPVDAREYVDIVDELRIQAHVGNAWREYAIYVGKLPTTNSQYVDERFRESQAPLLNLHAPSWKQLNSLPLASPLDQKYARGLAEYLLGVQLEVLEHRWRDARARYESAYGTLRPFSTVLSRTVCSVVEFRMNAFNRLIANGRRSVFWPAANLLCSPPRRVSEVGLPSSRQSDTGVWIDHAQDTMLDVAAYVLMEDYGKAEEELRSLRNDEVEEAGNWTKMQILSARISAALGRVDGAQHAYASLLNDPLYGDEARRYVHAQERGHTTQTY
jgi:hypothetical protein